MRLFKNLFCGNFVDFPASWNCDAHIAVHVDIMLAPMPQKAKTGSLELFYQIFVFQESNLSFFIIRIAIRIIKLK